ncbi:dehydrodolichyl diphosphate synthase complex subunit DHDDS-like isoform X1 [Nylanderia fulva]|uniref:dehydrodolichyl diphosphate synthase complex subunit DHDDS-like isoform X1 n=1 Tax=Nylanderia fulva TaxID=613905 RepID=UPI0010FBA0CA|nr:dehydrodolichyl diphosphate synthase complex subunit DHDDS-like isoform X1 [Nylanderia fulva]
MSWIWSYILYWFQLLALKIIKTGQIPKHVAIMMDGNRRYAKKRNMAKMDGNKKGYDKLIEVIDWCTNLGITEITAYTFSINNFNRSKNEVNGFMKLARYKFKLMLEEKNKWDEKGIRIRVIGNLALLSEEMQKLLAKMMITTKNNNKITLNLAFPYSSRDEITHAVKDILRGVKHGDILLEDINEDLISHSLYTYKSTNPDLLIRTSGEVRLSDFLLWQISNTCIYFSNVLWPEFNLWNFLSAIFYYQRCYSDLQKVAKIENLKPIVHNDRVSMYVNKLHHKREDMIENLYLSTVQP